MVNWSGFGLGFFCARVCVCIMPFLLSNALCWTAVSHYTGQSDSKFKIKHLCTMGHRMILKKCFAVAGHDKARTSLMYPSWSGVPLPTERHGLLHLSLNLHWPKRMAVKTTTSLVKTFYHEFFNKFDRLLTLNTKNFTGKLISAGEKSKKNVRDEMKCSYPFSITATI